MATINFPSSPVDGELVTANGMTFKYNAVLGTWGLDQTPWWEEGTDPWLEAYDSVAFAYDANGRIVSSSENTSQGVRDVLYTYADNKITQSNTTLNGATRTETFTYDGERLLSVAVTVTESP